ncbi:MAG TPA: hypothetical protein VGF69_23425 [Thermoanaerobaculia bacterium]|jgi:hypothetical protein
MKLPILRSVVGGALLCVAASSGAQSLPVPAAAPPEVIAKWSAFDGLPVLLATAERGPAADFGNGDPAEILRIDLFEWKSSEWHWQQAYLSTASAPLGRPVGAGRFAVLARRRSDKHEYWWAEAEPSQERLRFVRLRSIEVAGPASPFTVSLFTDGTAEARIVETRTRTATLSFVPLDDVVVCATATGRSQCVVAGAGTYRVELRSKPGEDARVIAVEHARDAAVGLKERGFSVLRPKVVELETARTAGLIVLTMPDSPDSVVDVQPKGCAVTRFRVASLPSPPSLTVLPPCAAPGIAIRPELKGFEGSVEAGSLLVAMSPDSPTIALESAEVQASGTAELKMLAPGDYVLKLLSALSGGETVRASIVSSDTATVSFTTGPLVKGKLRMSAGGAAESTAEVQAIRAADVGAVPGDSPDIADWVRRGVLFPDGRFAIAIIVPGPYTLHARWGRGIGSRSFEMKDPPATLDLGDVVLEQAPTVRGSVLNCAGGELRLIPLPDVTKPLRLSAAQLQRIPIDGGTRFFAEAVTPGEWLVTANCAGSRMDVRPNRIAIREGQDSIIDFRPAQENEERQ